LGVLAAVGVGAATGVVVALPTLRLRGLYLALATLAFAQGAVTIFFFPEIDTHQGLKINDLNFFGLSLQSVPDQTVIYGCLFAVASLLVLAVRRGRLGRRLVGLSDSPAACATVGLDVKLTRLGVFAASAGLAGLAGALYGGVYVTSQDFMLFTSLQLLLLLVIWGVRSVAGALFAGISLSALTLLSSNSGLAGQLPYLLTGAGIVMIGWIPNGILGIGWFKRESAVRRAIDATSRTDRTPAAVGTSVDAA
jgi:branched-chain amino acid transport system permease protein